MYLSQLLGLAGLAGLLVFFGLASVGYVLFVHRQAQQVARRGDTQPQDVALRPWLRAGPVATRLASTSRSLSARRFASDYSQQQIAVS